MERNEVSAHEVRVWRYLQSKQGEWSDTAEVAAHANVARRTAGNHLKRLTTLGLVDMAEVFPSHRYRVAEKADKRNIAYVQRLERAADALGIGSVK